MSFFGISASGNRGEGNRGEGSLFHVKQIAALTWTGDFHRVRRGGRPVPGMGGALTPEGGLKSS